MRVEFASGNIALQQVDAIINAANSSLFGGGGVDGAIHRAAGPSLLAECQRLRDTTWPAGLPAGEVVATGAGNLQAQYVLHTVGPRYAVEQNGSQLLFGCFAKSIELASALGVRTMAAPAVSTGVYGWPLDDCARIARQAVDATPSTLELLRFVIYEPERAEQFRVAYESLT